MTHNSRAVILGLLSVLVIIVVLIEVTRAQNRKDAAEYFRTSLEKGPEKDQRQTWAVIDQALEKYKRNAPLISFVTSRASSIVCEYWLGKLAEAQLILDQVAYDDAVDGVYYNCFQP